MLQGLLSTFGGAGGTLSAGLGSSATTGNADVKAATGAKNIGGNPNVSAALQPGNLLVIGGVALVGLILWRKFGR